MPEIPHARGRRKLRLNIQDVAKRVAEYHAETRPTKRRTFEQAFPRWFRYFADRGCPLAKELLVDPAWMRRFPVLTFNNLGNIDVDFIRSRLAPPPYLTDERDIFWRVRTNALGDVAQYLDTAYEKAVTWDSDAERDILVDALMTVAKRDDWSASVQRENAKLRAAEPHAIGTTARHVRNHWGIDAGGCPGTRAYVNRCAILALVDVLEGYPGSPVYQDHPPLALDDLFKQVPQAELYLRERARHVLSLAVERRRAFESRGQESEVERYLRIQSHGRTRTSGRDA
jgi:hypothetical protein